MNRPILALTLGLLLAAPFTPNEPAQAAAGARGPVAAARAAGQTVKTRKVGTSIVSLRTKSGDIVSGDNDFIVAITDLKGAPKSATIEGLSLYMPAMGSMAAMKSEAKLQPARMPGVYTGTLEVEMKGPWKATVAFKDEKGKHRAVLNIVAK